MNTEFSRKPDKVVALGASAGGIHALKTLFQKLPATINFTLVVVIHRLANVESKLNSLLQIYTEIPVVEVSDKEPIQIGKIYLAPSNYHLLFDEDLEFSLDSSERINYSRPSIDVCFSSLANAFGKKATAILLTGANNDGAMGLKSVSENGGACIVQNPDSAHVSVMPKSGLTLVPNATVLHLEEIAEFLKNL